MLDNIICAKCGEHRIHQEENTDLGKVYIVMGCFSEYYLYFPDRMELINQGITCKDREILMLKQKLEKSTQIIADILQLSEDFMEKLKCSIT